MTLPRVSERLEPVAAAEGQKELAAPSIREPKGHLDDFFGLLRGTESLTNTVKRRICGVTFPYTRCSLKKRGNLS